MLQKVQRVIQWKNRASNLNFQLFTLSVLKLVALWATNIESGSSDWLLKKNYFPLACHISWGLLILQCSLLHSKQSLQVEKLSDREMRKKVYNRALISFFPPNLEMRLTEWQQLTFRRATMPPNVTLTVGTTKSQYIH